MLEIFIGIIAGIVGGLGMGGGTILILLLSIFFDFKQNILQSTNIIFFIPTSIASLIVAMKNKNIDFKIAIQISFWGMIGAFIGAKISVYMNVYKLRKCFGIFLLIIATYQIYEYIKIKRRYNSIK